MCALVTNSHILDGEADAHPSDPINCAVVGWLMSCTQDTLRGHKMRATGACIGAVIGLVTITPAAGRDAVSSDVTAPVHSLQTIRLHIKRS
jgi:hypothetical protein